MKIAVVSTLLFSLSLYFASSHLRADPHEEIVLTIPGSPEVVQLPENGLRGNARSFVEEVISLDFRDEDIHLILRQVADAYGLNLVIPESLKGRTSIKLHNITWRQAFDVLLESFGYTYIVNRNIIQIVRQEALRNEPVDTRVFIVNYSDASDVSASLSPLIDAKRGGALRIDERSNALIITERPSRMTRIQELIDRLDFPPQQLLIEGTLFEMDKTNSQALRRTYSASEYKKLEAESGKGRRFVSNFSCVVLNEATATVRMTEHIETGENTHGPASGTTEATNPPASDISASVTVTPALNNAGFIHLDLLLEMQRSPLEAASDSTVDTGPPRPGERSIATKVLIKDGFTIAVGGMKHGVAAHPAGSTRQFVLFITAQSLNPDGFDYNDTLDPRVLHEMHILDREIPGYRIPKSERDALNEIREMRNEEAREKEGA